MRRSACIDEDFAMFVNELQLLEQKYNEGTAESKQQIRNHFQDLILNCKKHMGDDLPYATSFGVNRRFVSFYQPRLKLLKKTILRLR
ncbi:hypothetical protein TVAG_493420 [Trichomonas vaginalis G3]|uniref:Uncharacterized protein n=1 Tax=Trichomonas vaginalis (strain ATCC PRA-98 / G3) TaxID=412133 RepID=A2FFA8_TRIV3|nr:hypothetical protein TVAGG3_0462950 [Trichomonas vaginalis G3]EAX96400.1 hypothetical protein TVAG_493420 [Trichomonas vaginalis G3]KAI5514559.1 hypothetical protein TVAGG3_0462950 [Trichomonas vaginalis G3]|eukprot:XP_001309330.1 hypothetical protein [Trichomonas vaginalis G3]